MQVHLSHNSISAAGAAAIMAAIPAPQLPASLARSPGSFECSPGPQDDTAGPPKPRPRRPLWLRLEWNHIEAAELVRVLTREAESRGLVADIPGKRDDGARGHEQNLVFSGAARPASLPSRPSLTLLNNYIMRLLLGVACLPCQQVRAS